MATPPRTASPPRGRHTPRAPLTVLVSGALFPGVRESSGGNPNSLVAKGLVNEGLDVRVEPYQAAAGGPPVPRGDDPVVDHVQVLRLQLSGRLHVVCAPARTKGCYTPDKRGVTHQRLSAFQRGTHIPGRCDVRSAPK
eukprot:1051497-Prorocentrum_minimum.AAC.1